MWYLDIWFRRLVTKSSKVAFCIWNIQMESMNGAHINLDVMTLCCCWEECLRLFVADYRLNMLCGISFLTSHSRFIFLPPFSISISLSQTNHPAATARPPPITAANCASNKLLAYIPPLIKGRTRIQNKTKSIPFVDPAAPVVGVALGL
jgi:hypothetical protein